MKKVFGLTLMVAVVISLIGCGQNKAATTTEATTTEAVTEATTKEATTTEAPTTEATVTETVTTEASANDAEEISSSSEITENVVITENVNRRKVSSEICKEKEKTILLGYYDKEVFAVYITENGGNEIEVHLNKTPEFNDISFMFNYNFSEISLTDLTEYEGVGGGTGDLIDGVLEFTITYDNGRIVTVKVYAPEA